WIYKGEVIHSRAEREAAALAAARAPKKDQGRRTPRAPRGEVTTSSVDARAAATAVVDAPAAEGSEA
ncbi:MAG: 30S ribosomal protein S3, partial [Actinobacteria bacterium]|nr:30S ribosomal protein S3 [Actinomycetota bacterium]